MSEPVKVDLPEGEWERIRVIAARALCAAGVGPAVAALAVDDAIADRRALSGIVLFSVHDEVAGG